METLQPQTAAGSRKPKATFLHTRLAGATCNRSPGPVFTNIGGLKLKSWHNFKTFVLRKFWHKFVFTKGDFGKTFVIEFRS